MLLEASLLKHRTRRVLKHVDVVPRMPAMDTTQPLMPEQAPTFQLSILASRGCQPASPLLFPGQAIHAIYRSTCDPRPVRVGVATLSLTKQGSGLLWFPA